VLQWVREFFTLYLLQPIGTEVRNYSKSENENTLTFLLDGNRCKLIHRILGIKGTTANKLATSRAKDVMV
jgi:hypothetical protein